MFTQSIDSFYGFLIAFRERDHDDHDDPDDPDESSVMTLITMITVGPLWD